MHCIAIIHPMDIRQQDIGLLLALDVLLEEQNVTRAAERLGLSQPAMSAQLARLRDLFGDPLLVQSGKRMIPTVRAAEIRQPLNRAIADLRATIRETKTFDPATSERTFRILSTDYLHRAVASDILQDIAQVAPHVRIAMIPLDTRRSWEVLERGDAELLVTSDRLTPQDAKARKLFNESFVFVQRKRHPRGNHAPDLAEFCAWNHVLVSPEGGGFVGAIDESLSRLGHHRRVVVSLPSFLLALPIVSTTDLVAVLPKRLANMMAGSMDVFPLPFEAPDFNVMISWHARHHRDHGHQWIREIIIQNSRSTAV